MSPVFLYQVRDQSGQLQKGEAEGDNQQVIINRLRQSGLLVTGISKKSTAPTVEGTWGKFRKVSLKELAVFSRQFAVMINAGVALIKCLQILSAQTSNAKLKQTIEKVRYEVESGVTLSQAMSRHQRVFPDIMVTMIRAGETAGVLDEILARLAEHLEKEYQLKEKMKTATRYPILVMNMALIVLLILFSFVLPAFEEMFKSLHGELPLITKVMLGVSKFVQHNFLGIMGALLVLVVSGWKFTQSQEGQKVRDQLMLYLPVLGTLNLKVAISRFSRTLATLLHSGVPIIQALEMAIQTTGNIWLRTSLVRVKESIARGHDLATPLQQIDLFPPMVTQMIAIGEETGSLDQMLGKVADFYDQEVKYLVDNLATLLEPMLILILGIVVGSIILSVLLPMADLSGMAGKV